MKKTLFSALVIVALLAWSAGAAHARSSYMKTFNQKYGTTKTVLDSCKVCHLRSDGGDRNSFGKDFNRAERRFNSWLEARDSDRDGFSNLQEIKARTFPGNYRSRPTSTTPPPPTSGDHSGMIWTGSSTCLVCHSNEANQVHASVHYQWKGSAEELINGQPVQGKTAGAMNSYCVNILGNWNSCSACHVGLGAVPEETAMMAQLNNIDCLICHQKEYKRVKVNGAFVPDTANMAIGMDQAAQTVHKPTRATCLQCHAKGGGGDNNKRGDMPLALGNTSDRNLDVHMSTTGQNITCQQCHTTQEHRIAGRGNDLRPTDLNAPMGCSTASCHQSFSHADSTLNRHTAKIACQTCHISTFARDAADTLATEATEMHRDWQFSHLAADGKMHPLYTMVNNVKPVYRFWNGQSSGYTVGDLATVDPETGVYLMSRPEGGINDPGSKLYPFKYKTSNAPMASRLDKLIALDTSVYFPTGDVNAAVRSGLQKMGLDPNEPYTFVTTGEFQLITHEVPPKTQALSCASCHGTTAQMDLKAIGYGLKAPESQLCVSCHSRKENKSFTEIHRKHVTDRRFDCSRCHNFTRAAQ
ncbi:MAG: hypothetical protein WC291_07365 [Thermodesulfovibrionales bacterium]|jgi:nitrate reductase cytochrome c-type subunit